MPRGRKKAANITETSRLVEAFSADFNVLVPVSVTTVDTAQKEQQWSDLTTCRAPDQWLDADLMIVGEIVELQTAMQGLWQSIQADGLSDLNPKGAKIANPDLDIYLRLGRRRDGLLRLLKINCAGDKGSNGTSNRNAALQGKVTLDIIENNAGSLLA